MSLIRLLDSDTINQIAAGEVIDRPASIIKELVENSIDAGATGISIEISGGGISLIRITDNGSGISAEDVSTAFLRHATSKIKDASQLPLVTSLGFRGEALASIAAIADVELITRTADSPVGTFYHICGGCELEKKETGAPLGTTFIIRDVFENVPVRKKFLKTSATEGAVCSETIERIALSHPEVSFKFKNNGRNVFFTNGNGKLKEMIFGIYGRDLANEMLEIDGYSHSIHVHGVIARPVVARSSRNTENFFVNGRYIRSTIISKGIENAYQPYLMQHKFPFTCFYIDIDPLLMDVNVHPSKQEVRFENPEAVYLAVYDIISEALSDKAHIQRFEKKLSGKHNPEELIKVDKKTDNENKHSPIKEISAVTIKESEAFEPKDTSVVAESSTSAQKGDVKTSVTSAQVGNDQYSNNSEQKETENSRDTSTQIGTSRYSNDSLDHIVNAQNLNTSDHSVDALPSHDSLSGKTELTSDIAISKLKTEAPNEVSEKTSDKSDKVIPEPFEAKRMEQLSFDFKLDETPADHADTVQEFRSVFSKGYRIVGQVFNTYWIVECDGVMYMIDQHAAHEKIIYEKMMNEVGNSTEAQLLSPPLIVTLTAQEAAAAEKYGEELERFGYCLEEFGGKEYALSSVPLNLYGLDARDVLFDILDELAELPTGDVLLSVKEKIATCSCKAAVKGNHELSQEEAKSLITKLLEAQNPFNCPHGRPIIIDYSKYEIEKKFKRIL